MFVCFWFVLLHLSRRLHLGVDGKTMLLARLSSKIYSFGECVHKKKTTFGQKPDGVHNLNFKEHGTPRQNFQNFFYKFKAVIVPSHTVFYNIIVFFM